MDAADAEHTAAMTVFDGIGAGGVEANNPVGFRAAAGGICQCIKISQGLKVGKALANSAVS